MSPFLGVAHAQVDTSKSTVTATSKQMNVPVDGTFRKFTAQLVFDPAKPGGIYASVHEEALYVSQDYGHTWTKDGLEGSRVFRMRFVPEAPQ